MPNGTKKTRPVPKPGQFALVRKSYPWNLWLAAWKQTPTIIRQGRDFICEPNVMAQQIRNAASKRGVSVHVEITGQYVKIQVQQ